MTTATDIVKRSLRLARVLGAGETPSADELSDALLSLNAMLDSWQIQNLYVYSLDETTNALAPGTSALTIGPTGTMVMDPRPSNLAGSTYIRSNGQDYGLTMISEAEYDAIVNKAVSGPWPSYGAWVNAVPDGTLKLWPVANGSVTLVLKSWTRLPSFEAGDVFTLPPGYERAIAYSLAEEIAPEYGANILPGVAVIAKSARDAIKFRNLRIGALSIALMGNSSGYDIYADR